MRVAITYENGNVFMHYGKTKQFIIFDIEDNKIKNEEIKDTGEYSHHTLATFLNMNNVEILICGGLGMHAIESLNEFNIKIYNNASGNVHDVINDFLNNKLTFNGATTCSCHN